MGPLFLRAATMEADSHLPFHPPLGQCGALHRPGTRVSAARAILCSGDISGDWQTDKLEILGTRRWNMLKIMGSDYVWCIIYHAEGFCSSTEQLSGWKMLHVVRNLTGYIFVIWDLDLWAMHHPWSSWAVIATSAASPSWVGYKLCPARFPDRFWRRFPCQRRELMRGERWTKVCIVLMMNIWWIYAESLSIRDIIEISWVQTYFQKSKWTILVHVPRVFVQDAWTGEIWPTPSRLSPWPTKVSGAWQEPSGTLCQCQKTAHCGKKPQYTYVYLLYALYTPNCLKQFPNATKNNKEQPARSHLEESWQKLLPVVGLPSDLPRKGSLESQQLSILHTLMDLMDLMAPVRKFLLTNWLDAMTRWYLLTSEGTEGTVQYGAVLDRSFQQLPCSLHEAHHCQLRAMAKRCHWGPGFVDHEPPQAPPSKVVVWSWGKPIWIWNSFGISATL